MPELPNSVSQQANVPIVKSPIKFSIQIATKNRRGDLEVTLKNIAHLLERDDVECIVTDDGSSDGTFDFVISTYPKIIARRNESSLGYLVCRNQMLNSTATYVVTLDDDAHFLSENPLEEIETHFESHRECGLLAFRILWSKTPPSTLISDEKSVRVRGYVGCGHAWRMESWRKIPSYPEWFKFYGEETFASMHLFLRNIEIHYLPQVLIQHRVDLQARKNNKDYKIRYRNGLRADYFLFFLFLPWRLIPNKLGYSVYAQLSTRIFKGEFAMLWPLLSALWQVISHFPRLLRERSAFTKEEYDAYLRLEGTKIYWKP
ncbi:MAG: glycosyltransferase [Flavobacterium sp.]|nr:MAG: glycosyltransferase [Flavobacterium sp.]